MCLWVNWADNDTSTQHGSATGNHVKTQLHAPVCPPQPSDTSELIIIKSNTIQTGVYIHTNMSVCKYAIYNAQHSSWEDATANLKRCIPSHNIKKWVESIVWVSRFPSLIKIKNEWYFSDEPLHHSSCIEGCLNDSRFICKPEQTARVRIRKAGPRHFTQSCRRTEEDSILPTWKWGRLEKTWEVETSIELACVFAHQRLHKAAAWM